VGNTIIRYTVPVSIIGGGEGVIGENRRPADYIKLSIHCFTSNSPCEVLRTDLSERGVNNTTYINCYCIILGICANTVCILMNSAIICDEIPIRVNNTT